MSKKVADWIIWIIDIISDDMCDGDKTKGYLLLKQNGIIDWYTQNYETTHSLGKEYLIDEVKGIVAKGGVVKC